MKKLIIAVCFILLFTTACINDKAGILFNKYPITKDNIYDYEKVFPAGSRIYYVILMPKKVESRYLYIQVVKKDNDYGRLGYTLYWTKNIRLKDEEVNYFTDYFVIGEEGYYIMQVYSKDKPTKKLAVSEFYVQNP